MTSDRLHDPRKDRGWLEKCRELHSLITSWPLFQAFSPSARSLCTHPTYCVLALKRIIVAACYKCMRLTTGFYSILSTEIIPVVPSFLYNTSIEHRQGFPQKKKSRVG